MPESDQLIHMSACIWQGGGMVSTGLVAASVLGASTAMMGVVGDDKYGAFALKDFAVNGVDASHVLVDPGATTNFTIVLSETRRKARSFISLDGNRRALRPDELDEALIAGARYFLITDMDEVTVAACKIARRHGVKVVIDADIYDGRTVDNLELIDVFIASEIFYDGMCRGGSYAENLAKIRGRGPDIALVTLGDRGCAGCLGEEYLECPAFPIDVVDTTGAGDVFHGAFIVGLLREMKGMELLRFASAVSAIKCTRLGGRAGIADLAAVEKFLATGEIDPAKLDQRVAMYRGGMF